MVVNDLKGETADEVVARIKESGGEAAAAPATSPIRSPYSVSWRRRTRLTVLPRSW